MAVNSFTNTNVKPSVLFKDLIAVFNYLLLLLF